MAKRQSEKMEQATQQLKEWKAKLEKFNMKVPKPDFKPVEIVQDKDKDEDSNDSDWGDGVIVPEKKN